MAQRCGDARVVLGQANQFDAAFHVHAEFGSLGAQNFLGARLRKQQWIRIGAVDAGAHGEFAKLMPAVAASQGVQPHARSQKLIDHAEAGEGL